MFLGRSPCRHVGIWAAVLRGASRTFSVLGPFPLNVPPCDDENLGLSPPPPPTFPWQASPEVFQFSGQGPCAAGKAPVFSSASLYPELSVRLVVWHPGDARVGKPQSLSARLGGIHACESRQTRLCIDV